MTVKGTYTGGSGDFDAPATGLPHGFNAAFTEFQEPPALSESMVRRDNFFHSCWMEMKQRRPDLWSVMSEIELVISGYTAAKDLKTEDNNDADNNIL